MTDRKEYKKRYYQEHKELLKARSREWRQKNPDRVKQYNQEYYQKHKEAEHERTDHTG